MYERHKKTLLSSQKTLNTTIIVGLVMLFFFSRSICSYAFIYIIYAFFSIYIIVVYISLIYHQYVFLKKKIRLIIKLIVLLFPLYRAVFLGSFMFRGECYIENAHVFYSLLDRLYIQEISREGVLDPIEGPSGPEQMRSFADSKNTKTIDDFTKSKIHITGSDMLLINGIQGGMYKVYAQVTNFTGNGTFYIKAVDIVTGRPLSDSSIYHYTKTEKNSTYSGIYITYISDFTIKEGSRGNYYLADIQLRFRDNKGNEKLLLQKKYKVEGWQW